MIVQPPQELIDVIIDFAAGDAWFFLRTLRICALVCRSWVPRSRSHLFEKSPRLESDNDVLIFRDLLNSPRCTFFSHIRTVRFSSWQPHDDSFNEILAAADLRRLENVRALTIHIYIPEDTEIVDSFCTHAAFLMVFPAVTSLEFSAHIRNEQPLPLIDLISSFSNLRKLQIHYMSGAGPYCSSSAMPPWGLHCLKLVGQSPGPILAWLSAAGHLPDVDSITLHDLRRDHIAIVRAALQQVGGALHHLEFSLDIVEFKNSDVNTLGLFDLSLHPNLRVLSIRDSSWLARRFGPNQVLPGVRKLTFFTSKLERLELDLNQPLYQPSDWAALDALLSPASFPCLRSTVFAPTFPGDHELLPEALPLLEASGKLLKGVGPL
ncbi:hypothetical protein K438DRAFT_1953157 [Mycena galopus ATCC 62051]|nr:hypothetical protein K438DRAFT_1953157 [Mycena galopus ATCC 62051]